MWRLCEVGMFVVILLAIFAYYQTTTSPELSNRSQSELSTMVVNSASEEVSTSTPLPIKAEVVPWSAVDDRLVAFGFQPKEKTHALSVRPGGGSTNN